MYIFYLNCRIEVDLKNNSQCSNGTIPTVLSGMYSARPGKGRVQRIQYMDCMLLKLKGMYKIFFSCVHNSSILACGKTLISPEGTITSPEYPNLYPLNANCKWNLPIPENSSTFVYVAMETAALASNHTLRLQVGKYLYQSTFYLTFIYVCLSSKELMGIKFYMRGS